MYEGGHALGIRDGQQGEEDQDAHHPSTLVSVLYPSDYADFCSPNPLDVMAIEALYQTVDRTR